MEKKNKKIILLIVVVVIALLLICVGAFAIRGRSVHKDTNIATGTDAKEVQSMAENTDEEATAESSKPETTKDTENTDKKDTQTVAQDKPKKDDTKPQQTTEANTKPQQAASANTKPKTTETTEANTKPQTTQAATTEANTKPQTTQQTTTEAQPQKEKVWVVDQAAYDEERPTYETKERWICTGCGGYMYNQTDVDNHLCNASWYNDYYDVQVGVETIHHDEVGHWEYR